MFLYTKYKKKDFRKYQPNVFVEGKQLNSSEFEQVSVFTQISECMRDSKTYGLL